MQNYIVILKVSKNGEAKIRDSYKKTYDKKLPISNLHLTLLPPFSLKENVEVKDIKKAINSLGKINLKTTFGKPNLFKNPKETILYLPAEPEEKIKSYYEKLTKLTDLLINLETSLYHTDEVPPFLPHISLDYTFTSNSKTLDILEKNLGLEKFECNLKGFYLLTKKPSGNWRKV